MKHVLILNIGSSSIKYTLFKGESVVHTDYLERVTDFKKSLQGVFDAVDATGMKVHAIGHRVVHGGTIAHSVKITPSILKRLDMIKELAPLHDVPEIEGIRVSLKRYTVPQIAIFDTAFHHTMPEHAYTYAIPYKLAKKYGIRKYGFHGPSHHYVALEAAKVLKKPLSKLKLITCHLGNGASVTAINKGQSVDTSMGFTPLEGLVMGTRSGDLDPALLLFLQEKMGTSTQETNSLLNKDSGLLGLSGISNDVRDLHKAKSARAKLTLDVFCYRIVKYIGAYTAAMDGVDAIIFTAGIGEHAWYVREKILKHFSFLGIKLDKAKNKNNAPTITVNSSRVTVLVIPTNEALMMYREVRKLIS